MLPYPADSAAAARFRDRALRRQFPHGSAVLVRCGYAEYADGRAELVLAVRPDGWDDDARSRLAATLAGDPRDPVGAMPAEAGSVTAAGRPTDDQVIALLTELLAESAVRPTATGQRPARIDDLVLAAAARAPGSIAVSCAGSRLTYAQLVRRAAALALALIDHGVRRGDLVGVSTERGEHLVPSLLGVLLAGAAYVPLDPGYPADRLEFIASDAGLVAIVSDSVAVSDSVTASGAPSAVGPIRLDARRFPGQPADPELLATRRPARDASDAAYVIYTSGSTGRPKGVVVEHRNFAALLAATRTEFELSERDAWTLFHSYSFDFSVWEIWACLATGGRLVVVPAETATLPQEFRQLLHDERVTVLNQTPSAFTQLLSTERPGAPELAVRLLIFGGEKLDSRALLPWFDRHPERDCRVVNMYGITETTVHNSWTDVRRRHALVGDCSVGQALPGWTLQVLDEVGNPVAAGEYGEIYVGGAGVTRGYLNRPALTAERFGPDRQPGRPGGRLYRSGDRGRLRADGEIEHHGRLDNQVKVRGYRIELDEISGRIRELPGISAVTVVLNHRGEDADPHLDAYLVATGLDETRVLRHLRDRLPSYMVPSSVTFLDSLPLTGNGKLDPARLPAPQAGSGSAPAAEETAGESPLLEQVRQIWQRVLGRRPGAEDNFFLIGGNSLLAIRVVGRLREAGVGGEPSARLLYEHPTVTAFTAALASRTQ
ncbi:MAG: non-ribosomal peptide synthetase [Jatrophihabitantaceae bacterium]